MESFEYIDLLERLIPIVRAGAEKVMQVYNSDFSVFEKADKFPVTEADHRAEEYIRPFLEQLLPGVPVVAEEYMAIGIAPAITERFWLVDPVDGTKEFIRRTGEFTVNVALVEKGVPVLGVVHAPAMECLFAGALRAGAFLEDRQGRRPLACRPVPDAGLDVAVSRSHGDVEMLEAFLDGRHVSNIRSVGSSLKFCMLATGEADVYPRFGRTMEWDTAAGHAVLLASGGNVVDEMGAALTYGKPNFENPYFIAWGLGF